jgi:hypothetical protein
MLKFDANDRARAYGLDSVREDFDKNITPFVRPNGVDTHPRRFDLIPFGALKPGMSRNYVVKGLMPKTGVAVVWGPPKCGKSFVVFDMMLRVALCREYRGRRVQQGPVVYCAFEGAAGFHARAEAFRATHLPDDERVPFYLMPSRVDLVRDHAALIEDIRSQLPPVEEPTAVVLDTLNRSLAGSESSDEDMSAYIQAADAIREAFDCLVVIVHHCGIDGTRPRGHTSLTGAVDVQLAVKRDGDGHVVMTVEYMKDGPEGDVIASTLEQVEVGIDEDGDPITSCVVVPADRPASQSKDRKLSPVNEAGLRALHECLADKGEVLPYYSEHIPKGVACVTLDEWRDYLFKLDIINKDGSYREQFRRLRVKLKNAAVIGIWEEHVWSVT